MFSSAGSVNAEIFKTPVTKNTEQWSIRIGEARLDAPDMIKSKPGVFDVYSLEIKNNGHTLHNVTVEVYRDEPNSLTKFGLFSNPIGTIKQGQSILLHKNFPLSVKAKEVEVIVSWQDESKLARDGKTKLEGRKYKQSFIFKPNSQ
ncbi:Uncharacterized protein BN1090_A2_03637 [Aneurinibacillus migulanus]|nr:Uncharacterized protein BN1090_A2_03637 [Aneurinibacillus migulanus]